MKYILEFFKKESKVSKEKEKEVYLRKNSKNHLPIPSNP